jgi:Spy/CpxP family protein refolding chaperone
MMLRVGVALLVPVLLCAQPPRGRGPRLRPEVAKQLNLTDAQTKQMDQVNADFRERLNTVRDEVNKAEAALDAVFNEDPVDPAKGNDAINRLAAARGELTRALSQHDLKLRMILTAQQWEQLKQIEHEHEPWPGRGGRRRGPPKTTTPTPNGPIPQK